MFLLADEMHVSVILTNPNWDVIKKLIITNVTRSSENLQLIVKFYNYIHVLPTIIQLIF